MPLLGSSDESIRLKIDSTADTSGITKASGAITGLGAASKGGVSGVQKLHDAFLPLAAISATAGLAFNRLTGFMGTSVKAANDMENALLGLNTITKAFGGDADEATKAARELAEDGLMTVTDAANGLKNLLASGFNLEQSIKLMDRFKDSAAFNRQGTLAFGQAIVGATQGIKNGNSILVDNAGVTKNLSNILVEAGMSATDLSRATSDATVRQALFQGILKETNPFLGDAARLTETAAGKQAQMSAQTTLLQAQIGEALQPAVLKLLETVTPMIERFAKFSEDHPNVVAAVLIIGTVVVGLTFLLGSLGLALSGLPALFTAVKVVGVGAMLPLKAAMAGAQATAVALNGSLLVTSGYVAVAAAAALAIVQVVKLFNAMHDLNKIQDEINAQGISQANNDTGFYNSLKAARDRGDITTTQYNARFKAYNDSQSNRGRAAGGHVQAGQTYEVNEEGMELFTPNRSGTVIPHDKSMEIIGGGAIGTGGGKSMNVDIGQIVLADGSAVDRFFEMLDFDDRMSQNGLTPARGMS